MNLQALLEGEVVLATDPAYERRRREMVWNGITPEARPAAIVRVANETDVVACVRFARDAGLRVAVRGGGHNWYGAPLHAGALLLDLSRLDGVEIDVTARRAVVGATVESRDFALRLGAHGLAFPVGHCPGVKLSGYALSGGLGWNPGVWGPACASVEAVDVVTAGGERITVDERHDPDLFWAARGAGATFFAVATRFHLKLQALPRSIQTAILFYPLGRLDEVGAWVEAKAKQLAPTVELTVAIVAAPPAFAADCAADNGMSCMILATIFADTEAEAVAGLGPIEGEPPPSGFLAHIPAHATPFEALFGNVGQLFASGHRYLADTFFTDAAAAQVLPALARAYAAAPSQRSLALAVAGTPATSVGALSMPGGLFVITYAQWEHARDDDANRQWFRRATAVLEPISTGHYIGEADLTAPRRIERCYAPADWQRLRDLRRRYDPDSLFAALDGGP